MAGDRRSSSGSTLSSPFDSPTFDRDVSISVDEDVGAASISPSGRDVVLASKEGLYIIDLDSPYQPPRHIPNRSQWEVADVQWSPFALRDSWIVSTSNQKAIVWNLQLPGPNIPIEHVLRAHNGAITDINFSAHHPDLLATCGVDSFVICWDLRQRQNAVIRLDGKGSAAFGAVARFAAWDSGATQVKWNRQDSNIVASSHGQYLHIWDRRKGAEPLKKIDAHATKVYGIDWNRVSPTGILTCGLDKTIKIWDYSLCGPGETPQAERIIHTPYPVWRARHTPFGSGVLAMPQRGSTDLHLYDLRIDNMDPIDSKIEPAYSFSGHEDNVKEFLWRSRGGVDEDQHVDNRDFQLVSWGRDQVLQLHKMEPELLKSVGYERGQTAFENIRLTRKNATYRTFATDAIKRAPLQQPDSTDIMDQPKSHLTALFHPRSGLAEDHFVPALKNRRLSVGGSLAGGPIGMQMKSRTTEVKNVITWMKGVRMGKRNTVVPSKYGNPPKTPLSAQSKFDMTENLGDEITQVGSKFKKVSFEIVDVARRSATISLNGPWGLDSKAAFVRINMRFPPNYPRDATPDYELQKTTSAIADATIGKLDEEIQSILDLYKSRKKGSLEAVISYLLGERDLEESISLMSDGNDDDPDFVGEESSSDDEDAIGDPPIDGSGIDIPGVKNNVPIPRTSSARWTRDGRLIHVHPPKAEPKPFFDSILRHSDKSSKAPRLLETLGRLKASSPIPGQKPSVDHGDEHEGSGSDWETASSSSSGDSSANLAGITGQFPAPAAWQGTALRFNKTSQQSSADFGPKNMVPKSNSVISTHDFSNLLPSRRDLAEGYELCGDGPSVCRHNGEVARSHGRDDLGDIWTLISMILANSVPLEILPQIHRKEHILVVARRAIVARKRKDSGVDLDFDKPESVAKPVLKSRVKWGHHPLAATWLIPSLFTHFEKLADIQMLAMLACVFSEPAARDSVPTALLDLDMNEIPMSMQAPAFSLDYFSSHEAAWSLYQPASTSSTPTNSLSRTKGASIWEDKYKKTSTLTVYGSAGSSNGPWGSGNVSEPVTPYSTDATPPVLSRSSTFRSSGNASFSNSPEQRRSNTNLSSAVAMLSRPFISASPPTAYPKSRTAEAELSMSMPNSVTWGTNTFYSNSSSTTANTQRSSQSKRRFFPGWHDNSTVDELDEQDEDDNDRPPTPDGSLAPAVNAPHPSSAIRVTLKNQDHFDDEACVSSSLLAHIAPWRLVHYREQYANQLLIWGLAVQRSEILKFNGLHSYWEPEELSAGLAFDFGRKTNTRAAQPAGFDANSLAPYGYSALGGVPSPKKFKLNPEASNFVPTASGGVDRSQMHVDDLVSGGSSLTVTVTPAPESVDERVSELDREMSRVGPDTEEAGGFPHCNTCLLKVERLYSICGECGHIAHIWCLQEEVQQGVCRVGCGCVCDGEL